MYNLPGLSTNKHLNLSGDLLAQIYMGQIRYWDDSRIKAINKGISLPHKPIVTVHRSDSSGDTFLFTQFLSKTNNTWASKFRYGNTVSWPAVPGSVGAKGNSGIVQVMSKTPYSISYVGISYLDQAVKNHLGYAALKNAAGQYVLPTPANIQAAANAMVSKTPKNEILSLIYAPGKNAYPIINYEYIIVNSKQPDSATASALKNFLLWAISPSGGNNAKYLTPVHFLPLPAKIEALSKAQISLIH
jgi:phosphate transport system substrate-binding protein